MMAQEHKKSKLKVGLLRLREASPWLSCISITDNLCRAYSTVAEVKEYYLHSGTPTYEVIQQLIHDQVEVISIVDHRLRLPELFRLPQLVSDIQKRQVKIIAHTFGCFADRMLEYHEASQILRDQDFIFIGSSPRHVRLIQKVVTSSHVYYVPFAVDTNVFSFEIERRNRIRQQHQLSEDTLLFLYTGRISCLKNVELSMRLLAQARQRGKNLAFFYAGGFDGQEPIVGQSYIGQMEQVNAQALKEVDPHASWCRYLGPISSSEVQDYLCAADAYISLSTFRGEDFGMAIAEAKSAGLPAYLTDWGGYSGFGHLPETYLAKTTLLPNDIEIDVGPLTHNIQTFERPSIEKRRSISLATDHSFGIQTVAHQLQTVLELPPVTAEVLDPKLIFLRQLLPPSGHYIMSQTGSLYESYYS